MIYLLIIALVFTKCIENTAYQNAYEHIITNYSDGIDLFLEAESGIGNIHNFEIYVSNEIVPLEAVFFDNQIDELRKWYVFNGIEDIRTFLWEYSSSNSFDSYSEDLLIKSNTKKSQGPILFFSKITDNLLLADLIWIPKEKNSFKYDDISNFGRSMRFLLEIGEDKRITNATYTYVHHN